MKIKRILFFIIPFLVILSAIFWLNRSNRREIREKFLQVTAAEGVTISRLLELSGQHLMEETPARFTAFLQHLYENDSIIYIGLFQGDELVNLLSRYEGFFPVQPGETDFRVLDTAQGKIFETSAAFSGKAGERYRLYIGFDYEFLTVFEDAAAHHFYLVAAVFFLVMAMVVGLVIYMDKRFYAQELEWRREKQEKERFRELSLLTAEIAHEIRNPLNSIYLAFNTLEKYCAGGEEALFYRDAVRSEVRRISAILESYSRLSREIIPNYEFLDLASFLDSFRFMMEGELTAGKIRLTVEIHKDSVNRRVRSDGDLLRQMLLNLVQNAAEAGASEIRVECLLGGANLTVEVADNGGGIPQEAAESVFKPYFSTKTKGMGLGLHIVTRVVSALNGEIRLVSHQPGNTRFRVILPLKGHENA